MARKTIPVLLLLGLSGCATSNNAPRALVETNIPFTTTQAGRYTCSASETLVCREVLGSRVSSQEMDCVCQP